MSQREPSRAIWVPLRTMTKSIFAITLIVVFLGIATFVFYKKGNSAPEANVGLNLQATPIVTPIPIATPENTMTTMDNGLKIQDLRVGTGPEAKSGYVVAVNYVGTLENGKKFDSSYDRGKPFEFLLGAAQVIEGWDIGVAGMKVGGKRKLIIPPALAYGERNIGNGLIPPNSTLIFEVELLAVQAR